MSAQASLPVTQQCELLDIPRSSFYHAPVPFSDEELRLMRLINECHLKLPFYGSQWIKSGLYFTRSRMRILKTSETWGLKVTLFDL